MYCGIKTGLCAATAAAAVGAGRRYASAALTQRSEERGVRRIVLNNPAKRNCLSLAMMETLIGDVVDTQEDVRLRCIVISANGPVWSSGHDLKELVPLVEHNTQRTVFAKCTELIAAIRASPVPVIAQVNGIAAAAGCQLVASCDIAVCSDTSSFSTPGANFGIFCSTPGVALVRTVPRMLAAQMLLTGLAISAEKAASAGLVSTVVGADRLDAEVELMCAAIVGKSRAVVELGKRFFWQQLALSEREAYAQAEHVMADNLASADGREGVHSFVEKRQPRWQHTTATTPTAAIADKIKS